MQMMMMMMMMMMTRIKDVSKHKVADWRQRTFYIGQWLRLTNLKVSQYQREYRCCLIPS